MRRLLSTLLAGSALLPAAPAVAQTPPPQDTATAAQPGDEDTDIATAPDDIVVTGSRLTQRFEDSLQPLALITADTIDKRGYTNVAEAIDSLPGTANSVSAAGGQAAFGVGQSFANLLGLGTSRTLTLVNSRRFVTSNPLALQSNAGAGLQVDLNAIPTALIDRVEQIFVGGAPVYGADAIAGTVNIVLKRNFEGLILDGQYGIAEQGDGATYRLRGTAGANFGPDDRGNIAVSAEYIDNAGVLANARERTAAQYTFATNPLNRTGTDGIPGSILIRDWRFPFTNTSGIPLARNGPTPSGVDLAATLPGAVVSPGQPIVRTHNFPAGALENILTIADPANPNRFVPATFTPTGDLVPYNVGQVLRGFSDAVLGPATQCVDPVTGQVVTPRPATCVRPALAADTFAIGGDGINLGDFAQVTSELKRVVAYGTARYELTDGVRLFAEGNYYHGKGRELVNQPTFNAPTFGGDSGPVAVQTDNPFLTATQQATINAALTRAGVALPPGGGARTFYLSRANRDLTGDHRAESEIDLYRAVGGVEGEFSAGGFQFRYNAAATFGKSSGSFTNRDINAQRFALGVDAVRAPDGRIVCRSQLPGQGGTPLDDPAAEARRQADIAACVPVNLFGEGRVSPEAVGYVSAINQTESTLEQQVYEANLSADLFDLYGAGRIGFAMGYQHRVEKGSLTPAQFQQLGLGRLLVLDPIEGAEFNTDEVYGELKVPIISPDLNVPLVNFLEANGAIRYIDNSLAGGDPVYTLGGRYSPFRGLILRGNYTRSVRSPALTELFLPVSTFGTFAVDPCDNRNINSGANAATRLENCRAAFTALGLPADYNLVSDIQSAAITGTTGGNRALRNEEAKSWTAGFVFTPRFLRGLTLSADWIDIEITDAIVNLNASNTLRACYDNPDFPSSVCGNFVRDAAGQITSISTQFANAGYTRFSGLQADLQYDLDLGRFGGLDLTAGFFFVDRRETSQSGAGFDLNRGDGEIGDSKYRVTARAGYSLGRFNTLYEVLWRSSALFDRDFTPESRDLLRVDDYYLHSVSFGYDILDRREDGKNVRLRFIVNNLFDEEPPFPVSSAAYNLLGRYFTIGMNARF